MAAETQEWASYNKASYHGGGLGQLRTDGFKASTGDINEIGDKAKVYKVEEGHLSDVILFTGALAASALTISVNLTDGTTTYEIIADSTIGVAGGCARMDDTLVSANARAQVLGDGWWLEIEATAAAVTPAAGLVGLHALVHPDP